MAHFAEINQANEVVRVVVVSDEMLLNEHGRESEAIGIAFCKSLFGANTRWVQTSYTGKSRKNYAGDGSTFDPVRDAFIPPKPPGDYWLLDEQTCRWYDPKAPESHPTIGVTRV